MNKSVIKNETLQNYRVLARKYRPKNFSELLGQEALVKTISGSMKRGRISHAFLLHGVRGVGKTSTARILAKLFNCISINANNESLLDPCEKCSSCLKISSSSHIDVIEMDAASHTGVDNIRELIDGVSYKPVETKYRIYIIDEVHMLSKGAFNALLKTLEEPPEHTKFIFATTEIKKVPVTVLSRCQRFDLKRVSIPNLVSHLEKICLKEKISFDNESLGLIALSSEGSVRDSMSILDQAAAMMNDKINSNELKTMLALPNRLLSITIVENTLNGEIKKSLELYDNYISSGGNGESILNDCLEVIHLITRYAVVGENSINLTLQSITNEEHDKFIKLSKIQMPDLIRAWQIVLKGLEEIKFSPDFDKSAAMILIRLAYASSLPEPGEILKKIKLQNNDKQSITSDKPKNVAQEFSEKKLYESPKSFNELVNLFNSNNEMMIHANIISTFHLVAFEHLKVKIRLSGNLDEHFLKNIKKKLFEWTNENWEFFVVEEEGEDTIQMKEEKEETTKFEEAKSSIEMKKVFDSFPGAQLKSIKGIKN